MWAHGDVYQSNPETVETMMDIVHGYIFDIVSSPLCRVPSLDLTAAKMTPPKPPKPSPPNYTPQTQRFQAVTPSILHKRLQAPHHRKKLASLKEVVARQKVEKQKKKTHTAKPKAGNPVAAAALGGLGAGLDEMDFLKDM